MKTIFLSDSDEEAMVEFVKQHEELYDKTNDNYKDNQRKEDFGRDLKLPGTYLSILSRSGSRLNVVDMASSLRRKGMSRSSAFKSPGCPSAAATASVPDTS